ncbi:ly-6/neurotoxin-like protein 1 [Melozone crissalis]|uniref:ly-6/neurotoxin-like protein 1 n=1 Tax=Melozone crissalis TaxID=40204 RepID=UPI0023D9C658|nr:ly-6/neurotoxin-like protein 1 [Melozone crissalis]
MEPRTFPTTKLLLLGLSLLLCLGAAEALRCHLCKYKMPLVGCLRGANVTSCERREKCALIKTSLGKMTLYYQQGCTSALNCGRERASDAESRLSSRYSCCETDLCNEEWGEERLD